MSTGRRILVGDRADGSLAVWQARDRVGVPAAEQCIDDPTRKSDRRGFGAGPLIAERRLEVPAWLPVVITVDRTALGVERLCGDDREL